MNVEQSALGDQIADEQRVTVTVSPSSSATC
jgi:hypothetical protein